MSRKCGKCSSDGGIRAAPRFRAGPDCHGAGCALMPAIDIHFHVLPPLFVDGVRRHAFDGVVDDDSSKTTDDELVFRAPDGVAVEPGPAIRPQLLDTRLILAEMDRRKLGAAAVSPPPQLFAYWATREVGE